eukprot:4309216-Pleurochrysis_carterae.AAC.9
MNGFVKSFTQTVHNCQNVQREESAGSLGQCISIPSKRSGDAHRTRGETGDLLEQLRLGDPRVTH